jgi:hypothetical protein
VKCDILNHQRRLNLAYRTGVEQTADFASLSVATSDGARLPCIVETSFACADDRQTLLKKSASLSNRGICLIRILEAIENLLTP